MNYKSSLTTIIFTLFSCTLSAQVLPVEKVVLFPEYTHYMQGDTIAISGKLFRTDNDSVNLPYSRFCHIELINDLDSVCVRQKIRVSGNGDFLTKFPLYSYLPSGKYYLRSYSRFMMNYNLDTFPIVPIQLGKTSSKDTSKGFNAFIYPEGGQTVDDIIQNYGIYICDNQGKCIPDLPFKVFNEKNEQIMSQSTGKNGWQLIHLNTVSGSVFTLHADLGGIHYAVDFPAVERKPVLHTVMNKKRVIYQIYPQGHDLSKSRVLVYHSCTGLMDVSSTSLNESASKNVISGIIDVQNLPQGLLSVLLCDDNGNIQSQSSCLLSGTILDIPFSEDLNQSYADIVSWKTALDDESTLNVRFVPVEGDFSAVFTAEKQHITTELSSPHPFESSFAPEEKEAWLYSASFKRLNVTHVLHDGLNFHYKPERKLSISGSVKNNGISLKEGSIVAYQQSNAVAVDAPLEKSLFTVEVEDYDEDENFFIQAWDKIGLTSYYDYEFYNDTLPGIHNWLKEIKTYNASTSYETIKAPNFDFNEPNALPEIVVRPRVSREKLPQNIRNLATKRYISPELMERKNFVTFEQLVDYFYIYMFIMQDSKERAFTDQRHHFNNTIDISGTNFSPRRLVARRNSTFEASNDIIILLDGFRTSCEEMLSMDMTLLESAEYVAPVDAGRYAAYAMNGILLITTKNSNKNKKYSKGVYFMPSFGISNMHIPVSKDNSKPSKPGKYKMIVDLISLKKGIHSFVGDVEL